MYHRYQPSAELSRKLNRFVGFNSSDPNRRAKIASRAEKIRACIKREAAAEGIIVLDDMNAGSFAKHTGLRRHMEGASEVEGQDVDIAFILRRQTQTGRKLRCIIPQFEHYLKKGFPNSKVGHTKSSATIAFSNSNLQFDAVPLYATENQRIQQLIRLDGQERQSSIQAHTLFVKKRSVRSSRQPGAVPFNNCVRLVKWWRYQQQSTSRIFGNHPSAQKVPSIAIDLLCAFAYDQTGITGNYLTTLYRWFEFLREVVRTRRKVFFHDFIKNHPHQKGGMWRVMDPMDATNNIVRKWREAELGELNEWLTHGFNCLHYVFKLDQQKSHQLCHRELAALFGRAYINHA